MDTVVADNEGPGSVGSSDLGLASVGDHPQHRAEDEDDQHDVTDQVPAHTQQPAPAPPAWHNSGGICKQIKI